MLARTQRITSSREFAGVIRRGRRAGSTTLVVHLAAAAGQESTGQAAALPRAGLVVGRAVGNAVTRNQVKRRLRHLLRARLSTLPGGTLLVVRALGPAGVASSANLGADLDGAVTRALKGRGSP